MTAPETDLMTDCPIDIEELAAFIDGRLTPERRAQVIEHLDTCADCRDIVMTADQYARTEKPADNVVRGRFGRRTAIPAAAAAAAIATWLFVGPLSRSGMETLVAASASMKQRPIAARFSADFPHKDYPRMRGNGEPEPVLESTPPPDAYKVANVGKYASAKRLHAAGVALMMLDEPHFHEQAVKTLKRAAAKRPNDPEILTDLSAAYEAVRQSQLALETADRALAIKETPAAIWNRATALESLRQDDKAREAWNRYLQLDPSSEWAAEVRARQTSY